MPKLPSIQFYPGDWLRDPVAGCSLAAQGLWLRMLLAAHDSPRYGYLCNRNGSALPSQIIASKCGCSLEQYETLLAELDSVSVPSRTQSGTLYSRRMVRDERRRGQWRKSKQFNKKEVIPHRFHTNSTSSSSSTSNLKTPLPPAGAGDEQFFIWCRETIGVQMGRRRRLPGLSSFDGAQAARVVDFLNQKGFSARIVSPV